MNNRILLLLLFWTLSSSLVLASENPTSPQNEEIRYCFLRAESLCSKNGKKVVYSTVIAYAPSRRDEILADFQELLAVHYFESFHVTFDAFSKLYLTPQEAEEDLENNIRESLALSNIVEFVPERGIFVKK